MKKYVGNPHQLCGVEEVRLVGGKGDGMRLFNVRNGGGLEFSVSLDRCADISRLTFKGDNMGFFAPCGYVSPKYYDKEGIGFLKSFTAGFFTTCGLTAVGTPCTDDGEVLPLHGTISNTPCENVSYEITENEIKIKALIRDASLFAHKLVLEREYICPIGKNEIYLKDKVVNIGTKESPLEVLYHCNMGYPLLSENATIKVPSTEVAPRNEHSAEGIENCLVMETPQAGYEEKCYYHKLSGNSEVSIYNKDIKKGVFMYFDTAELPFFTEWRMMGEGEYVLGLEPGNCTPDGRNVMRENGLLDILRPGEERIFHIKFAFVE